MILKEEGQLLQNIKQGHLYKINLLYGEEKHLKDFYLKKLIKLAVDDNFPEFNLHRFDGNNLDVNKIIEACEAMPFMAPQRCVVVEKLDYEGISAADKEKFDAILKDPVESTVLILIVDKQDFNPKKSAKAKKLVELCDKAGVVLNMAKRSQSELTRFIRARVESRGCTIDRGVSDYLMECCENDMLLLTNEIEKITAFVTAPALEENALTKANLKNNLKNNEDGLIYITREDIEKITVKTVNASIYDLAKAILADKFEKAMAIVEDLIYLRYQPTVILMALSGAYTDLYIAKIAKSAGKNLDEIKNNFNYHGRDFVIKNNLQDCTKYSLKALRKSVCRLAEVDSRLKSSRADNNIILEQTITELFLLAK